MDSSVVLVDNTVVDNEVVADNKDVDVVADAVDCIDIVAGDDADRNFVDNDVDYMDVVADDDGDEGSGDDDGSEAMRSTKMKRKKERVVSTET